MASVLRISECRPGCERSKEELAPPAKNDQTSFACDVQNIDPLQPSTEYNHILPSSNHFRRSILQVYDVRGDRSPLRDALAQALIHPARYDAR